MIDSDQERRQALAAFLRQQRARLTPAEVGLPAGMRRRTPGLRREEVAQLANIGASWYVWLEQGRDVHPSAQVLESLAQALRLTLNERRYMFLLAGQPLPAYTVPEEERASPALQRLLAELDPVPAYVVGRRLDYLAWNRAADLLLNISEPTPPYDFNSIWRLFVRPSTQRLFVDWERVGRHILAEFHTLSARYPKDRWIEQLIADLKRASPEFCDWWLQPEALSTAARRKALQHPLLGHVEFEFMILQLPSDPDVAIHIYTPLGDSRANLQKHLAIVRQA
jgi:transcriptional regulator with XRE-family HTH domain